MVQATPVLAARLRFTTKSVGRGFYRGNRVGSTGAHTKHGGYLIDWRKTTNYNVPEGLDTFKLTPYVTREINPKQEPDLDELDDTTEMFSDFDQTTLKFTPVSILDEDNNKLKKDLLKHLTAWRKANPEEVERRLEEEFHMQQQRIQADETNVTKDSEK